MAHRVSAPIDVKTRSSDPACFAVTRIQIRIFFVTYGIPGSELPMLADSFYRELPNIYDIACFLKPQNWQFAVISGQDLADRSKTMPDLPQWKTNLYFYMGRLQKYMCDRPKSMLGIRIPVRLDQDLFGQIQIFEL
jgi:hypothetical protein